MRLTSNLSYGLAVLMSLITNSSFSFLFNTTCIESIDKKLSYFCYLLSYVIISVITVLAVSGCFQLLFERIGKTSSYSLTHIIHERENKIFIFYDKHAHIDVDNMALLTTFSVVKTLIFQLRYLAFK